MQFIPLQAGLSAFGENCQNIVHKMTLKSSTPIAFLLVISPKYFCELPENGIIRVLSERTGIFVKATNNWVWSLHNRC